MLFKGKGKTRKTRAKFTATEDFYFGGKKILKGSTVEQWETTNFGWTLFKLPGTTKNSLAKE